MEPPCEERINFGGDGDEAVHDFLFRRSDEQVWINRARLVDDGAEENHWWDDHWALKSRLLISINISKTKSVDLWPQKRNDFIPEFKQTNAQKCDDNTDHLMQLFQRAWWGGGSCWCLPLSRSLVQGPLGPRQQEVPQLLGETDLSNVLKRNEGLTLLCCWTQSWQLWFPPQ